MTDPIAAERERCTKIAEEYAADMEFHASIARLHDNETAIMCEFKAAAAETIARLIREPPPCA